MEKDAAGSAAPSGKWIPATPKMKKGRLIVRNLSFKANEEAVKKVFEEYGKIVEVSIPKKPDGKMLGFCFVQFDNMKSALKARKGLNLQPLLGRPIAVDISFSKEHYAKLKGIPETKKDDTSEKNNGTTEEEKDDDDFLKVNSDDESDDASGDGEPDDDDDAGEKSGESGSDAEDDESSGDEDEESDSEDDDDSDEEPASKKPKTTTEGSGKKTETKASDVGEGKTLFVRNLSFDTTNDTLRTCFAEFGELDYAVVCYDRDTEHSKGTAFVKFKEKDCAWACLEKLGKEEGLVLDGQKVFASIAISREEVKRRADEKVKKAKDKRNLYLAREGLIRPGTQAAEDVSKKDLDIRTGLDVWKRNMLTNNNIFISTTRLCVRNLPQNFQDDSKLGSVFLKAAGEGAKITEARIIRNLNSIGPDGLGVSRGFGYVNFTEPEHAMTALRNTNNNPQIFGKKSRPIVDFSLENKVALNAKQKRLERNRIRNKELAQEKLQKNKTAPASRNGSSKPAAGHHSSTPPYMGTNSAAQKFMGSSIGSQKFKGLPSHSGPKVRHVKRGKGNKTAVAKDTKAQQQRGWNAANQKPTRSMKRAPRGMKPPMKKKKWSQDETKLQKLVNIYHKKQNVKKSVSSKKQKKWFSDS